MTHVGGVKHVSAKEPHLWSVGKDSFEWSYAWGGDGGGRGLCSVSKLCLGNWSSGFLPQTKDPGKRFHLRSVRDWQPVRGVPSPFTP